MRVADFGLSRVMADLHTMASGAAPADVYAHCSHFASCTLQLMFPGCPTPVLLRVAEACVLTAQTGGLGTYEYMAPEVLAHQRYSEKVKLELNGSSLQPLYVFVNVAWLCNGAQHFKFFLCIRAGGRVLLWGGALGDVCPRDAIPRPQRHAGDLHMP